ncbi:MAG: NDP-glucose 4-epimerase [Candidatus Amesbacteria bacterium GW2011_GWB1_47_26]|uniref:NDP-glucose 4-epimerase n=1 Tax=Candidatus Amesbacteria bacterium GW2011_GWC2_45_19 TaxID=1618366 RepID=A0A0G1M5F5_9BACT|nr:MAG: NDP-glucose 4-epimerase [Candidatus Amesbacteria bacterium GW2011_GWC2_45_19]KKU38306.1 MAG: NDP-glucose 4-epimerase [Candidatus Amesbacteria bacterium GW2011_GWA1_46_35]KKU69506.1 MAG: NDP-glucose 4-epimerase [Microgenomates group bacterium GW2011_GWC1_47_20]KKU75157.1 MAG: NDP-glucose 4-epimerase [Candidatus Amesbacteria bacterium GW2011_GWB1_47_26]KKU80329.1 MAG: NDP-glucose 4-epimerase [Candidatus Amesbacteria bacterium GW2011_GWA2_47_70]
MKCLVTGQSGLIGSHLVDLLLKNGHEVYGISRTNRNKIPGSRNFCLDLRDTKKARETIELIAPEVVFALAANAAEGKSFFSPIEISTSCIDTFFNTLVPSIRTRKLKRFVFTSSIAVYGSIPTPFKESNNPQPKDIYGISKLTAEKALKVMSQVYGFEYVIVRPHNVFGPRQNMSDPYRNVVTLFMNQILKNEPYVIYGNGEMKRCFSYIDEVVEIIHRCGFEDVAGMIFNVGSNLSWSINELSAAIQKITRSKVKPTYLPERVNEVQQAISDHSLLERVFGYNDTPLEVALRRTWKWAKAQGPQKYKFTRLELSHPHVPKNWKSRA